MCPRVRSYQFHLYIHLVNVNELDVVRVLSANATSDKLGTPHTHTQQWCPLMNIKLSFKTNTNKLHAEIGIFFFLMRWRRV